jgi:hypothetical protein
LEERLLKRVGRKRGDWLCAPISRISAGTTRLAARCARWYARAVWYLLRVGRGFMPAPSGETELVEDAVHGNGYGLVLEIEPFWVVWTTGWVERLSGSEEGLDRLVSQNHQGGHRSECKFQLKAIDQAPDGNAAAATLRARPKIPPMRLPQ